MFSKDPVLPDPILDFWGPYAKLCVCVCGGGGGGGGSSGYEWNAFVCVSLRLESRSRNVSLLRLAMHSTLFLSRARDFTTFTLHDLTVFHIERTTAPHYNKWSFMFPNSKTKMKSSLRARGAPGVSGALRSLRILRIGRIGSGYFGTKLGQKKWKRHDTRFLKYLW